MNRNPTDHTLFPSIDAVVTRGIDNEADLDVIGDASLLRIVELALFYERRRLYTRLAFKTILDRLTPRAKTRLRFLWEQEFEEGDVTDLEFQSLVSTVTPDRPYLPMLRPEDHFKPGDRVVIYMGDKMNPASNIWPKYIGKTPIVEAIVQDSASGLAATANERIIDHGGRHAFQGHWRLRDLVIDPRFMKATDLAWFRERQLEATDMLGLYFRNGGGDVSTYDAFKKAVFFGEILPYQPPTS